MSSNSSKDNRTDGPLPSRRISHCRPFRNAFLKGKNLEIGQSSGPSMPCPQTISPIDPNQDVESVGSAKCVLDGSSSMETNSTCSSDDMEMSDQSEHENSDTEEPEVASHIQVMVIEEGELAVVPTVDTSEGLAQAEDSLMNLMIETFGTSSDEIMQGQGIGLGEFKPSEDASLLEGIPEQEVNPIGGPDEEKNETEQEVDYSDKNFANDDEPCGEPVAQLSPVQEEVSVVEISSDSSPSFVGNVGLDLNHVLIGGSASDPIEIEDDPMPEYSVKLEDEIENQMAWGSVRQGVEPNQDTFMNLVAKNVAKGEAAVECVPLEAVPRPAILRFSKPRMAVHSTQDLGINVAGSIRLRTRATAQKSVAGPGGDPSRPPACTACGGTTRPSYDCPFLQESDSELSSLNLLKCTCCWGYGHCEAVCPFRITGARNREEPGPSGTVSTTTCPFAYLPHWNRVCVCGCAISRNP